MTNVPKPIRCAIYTRKSVAEPHAYKTIVIDTADWAEKLLIVHMCMMHHTGKPTSDPKAKTHWTGRA